MTVVARTLTVRAAPGRVLDHLRDFGNSARWDPAARTVRLDEGPIAVGSSWHHHSKIRGVAIELTYALSVAERDRLVFVGRNEGATSTETVTVRTVAGGTEVTYHVDLQIHGLAKLMTPVMRAEFERLGTAIAARLTDVLDRLAPPHRGGQPDRAAGDS